MSADLFTVALGLQAPWIVEDIRFEPEQGEIHFDLACQGQRLSCPACGAEDQLIHDRPKRSWQHLHFFQYRAYLHAGVPRVKCAGCGKVTQVPVPWARPGSGFTLLLDALVLTLARKLPIRQIALLLGVGEKRIQQAITVHVEAARARESYAEVSQLGVDEKHVGGWAISRCFMTSRIAACCSAPKAEMPRPSRRFGMISRHMRGIRPRSNW